MTGTARLAGLVAARALCAQVDPELFFVEKGGDTSDAKRVCAACPVTAQCLQLAVDLDATDGVWGGVSPRQRRGLPKTPGVTRAPAGGPPALDVDRVEALAKAGLTTQQIADSAGVSTKTVHRIVREGRAA